MKKIIKIVAFSFVILLGTSTLSAQELTQNQDRPEVVAKQQVAALSDVLDLNGDQQRAVFRALVSKESNYRKNVNGKDLNNATVLANKKKYDATLDAAMKKTLSKSQYEKWLSLKDQ
ncbi:MAG: hypothetical protein HKN48_02765 [Flavobacteriaceae bacterium]|nr:hypothetical protein [Flavobacteriaceae bacterium]